MDHNDLIDNPELLWDEENRGNLDAETLEAAWEQKSFRDQIISDMVRMLDEDGGFGSDWDLWEIFGETLDEDQVLQLFETIREQTDRLESEWRGEFESIFEGKCDDLPDVEEDEEEEFDPSEDEEW